jgi:hypothetical protein
MGISSRVTGHIQLPFEVPVPRFREAVEGIRAATLVVVDFA